MSVAEDWKRKSEEYLQIHEELTAAWDETKHPRHPAGSDEGGEFAPRTGITERDLQALIGRVGPFAYHTTKPTNVESILERGIIPQREGDDQFDEGLGGTAREAQSYLFIPRTEAEAAELDGEQPLRIDMRRLDPRAFRFDEDLVELHPDWKFEGRAALPAFVEAHPELDSPAYVNRAIDTYGTTAYAAPIPPDAVERSPGYFANPRNVERHAKAIASEARFREDQARVVREYESLQARLKGGAVAGRRGKYVWTSEGQIYEELSDGNFMEARAPADVEDAMEAQGVESPYRKKIRELFDLESPVTAAGWDEAKHPRDPGGEGGGQWVRKGTSTWEPDTTDFALPPKRFDTGVWSRDPSDLLYQSFEPYIRLPEAGAVPVVPTASQSPGMPDVWWKASYYEPTGEVAVWVPSVMSGYPHHMDVATAMGWEGGGELRDFGRRYDMSGVGNFAVGENWLDLPEEGREALRMKMALPKIRHRMREAMEMAPESFAAAAGPSLHAFSAAVKAATERIVEMLEGQLAEEYEAVLKAAGRDAATRFRARATPLTAAGWDESKHPRHPSGSEAGGEFAEVDWDAIDREREEIRRPYRERGIRVWRGLKVASPSAIDMLGEPTPERIRALIEMNYNMDWDLGIHWTTDPDVAERFSRPNPEFGSYGVLVEALVLPEDIIPIEEYPDYREHTVFGLPTSGESELPIRPGSTVMVQHVTQKLDGGERLNRYGDEDMEMLVKVDDKSITSAGPPERAEPVFQFADDGSLIEIDKVRDEAAKKTRRLRQMAVAFVADAALESVGISLDLGGVFSARLLDKAGLRAADMGATVQRAVTAAVTEGMEEGWSVPQTADAIRDRVYEVTPQTATMLARTDLVGLANAGSMGAARLAYPAGDIYKRWINADDHRVRPTHVEAGGQTVPINHPFQVGGVPLDFPGDPDAPDGEVINCRCTIVYVNGLTAAAWVEELHPRHPSGSEAGGEFALKGQRRVAASYHKMGDYEYAARPGTIYMVGGPHLVEVFVEDGVASLHVRRLVEWLNETPPSLRSPLRRIDLFAGENPANDYWSKKYGLDGFTSYATADADAGIIHVWNPTGIHPGSMWHELGHLAGKNGGPPISADYKFFVARDADQASSRAVLERLRDGEGDYRLIDREEGKSTLPLGTLVLADDPSRPSFMLNARAVTDYGHSSPNEDWAESVELMMLDRKYGGLVSVREGDFRRIIRFDDAYPARARILREVFPDV